jgi:hypothetical protein
VSIAVVPPDYSPGADGIPDFWSKIMSINWEAFGSKTAKTKVWAHARKVITADTYGIGPGQWCLTELATSTDARRHVVLQVLDGVNAAVKRVYGIEPLKGKDGQLFRFKFRVLSRQACCRTGDGAKIWQSKQAMNENGSDGDILPNYDDKPTPGDVVEVKNQRRVIDDETGEAADGKTFRKWSMRGERPDSYNEYVVDDDLCIEVPYPFALMMLSKHGKNIAQPRFRKTGRTKEKDKKPRKITNWWFEEYVTRPKQAGKKTKPAA